MPDAHMRDEERPTTEEIRAAVDRIAASDAFCGCPQLIAFLRYVIDATLRGGQDRIKGYTIAVEALGRGDDFNPQDDPIVRVEAMRLRRALQRYYANGGRHDAVQIILPLGSYVPIFRRAASRTAPLGSEQLQSTDRPAVPTAWQDFLLFLAAYMEDDRGAAAHYAALIPSRAYPLDLVARALIDVRHSETEAGRAFLERLGASQRDRCEDSSPELARQYRAEAIAKRIVQGLAQIEGVAAKA
jgi:hypothetical protein